VNELILIRHGETEWSRDRRHTGRTDVPLTAEGEAQARRLAPVFERRPIARVLTSPAARARRTAELAGLTDPWPEPDLWEWDYGGYEGISTRRIREDRPHWYLWQDGVIPGDVEHPGETLAQVGERADAVLARMRDAAGGAPGDGPSRDGAVVVVGHGHALRVLVARWLGLEPAAGRLFVLDTATFSILGREHGRPVVKALNVPPS
jgi:broad specificity phosphatase PhoE